MNSIKTPAALLALVSATLVAAGCGGASAGSSGDSLSLVAYSTPKEAYEEIVPAFARTPAGRGVSIRQSYGSSGDQARAVAAGLRADLVALSLEPDVTKLVDSKLVEPGWDRGRDGGVVTRSVVTLVVREGNPKGVDGWEDLLRDDVEVLTPNPFTSGGARWNVMAAYGAQRARGRSDAQAVAYLERLFANVSVQDKSAREALQTFSGGKGDVLISYENEAITAQQKGAELDYVIPDETILIENPVAVTADAGHKAEAFRRYLASPPAQRVFAEKGYRSIRPELVDERRYPKPKELFTIARFGGWEPVMKRFFDPEDSIMQRVEEGLGVGTG